MTIIRVQPNSRDPITVKALLATVFSDYDKNRTDLTGTPNIVDVSITPETLRLEFTINNKPYAFFYDYEGLFASGFRLKPDEECGSDDDPDWEMDAKGNGMAWSLLAFIAACKEGMI